MIFYILSGQITALLLSINLLTTLSFDSEVLSYFYGGDRNDIFIELTNNQKTLAIKAKREGIKSNMLVITRSGKFYFSVSEDEKNPHQFLEIKQGQINHGMKLLKANPSFEIWEGASSLMVARRGKEELNVNGVKVLEKEYFSKGPALFINSMKVEL